MSKNVTDTSKTTSRSLFITWILVVVGSLQILVLSAYGYIIYHLIKSAQAGNSGTEIMLVAVSRTAIPLVITIAVINVIGSILYFMLCKPKKIIGIGFALSLALSIAVLGYMGYGTYLNHQDSIAYQKQREITETKHRDTQRQNTIDNAQPEITKENAIELIKQCQLKGLYIGGQTDKKNGNWGELSSTGVVLTKIDGEPYRISIADKLVPEIMPVAREAQKTCHDLQFSVDGTYEVRQADGTWR